MPDDDTPFVREVKAKAARKLAAQRARTPIVALGLGMFGAIGWSVATPTVLGALLGAWWDRHQAGAHSHTLMLLVAGLVLGCANAWRWMSRANAELLDDSVDHDE
jgi:ATP synthase protein I